jgi:riboflavin synthase
MFTGIVRETGTVVQKLQSEEGATFRIQCREVFADLGIGHSISVDGVCLTVTAKGAEDFTVVATPETLRLTNLGDKRPGDPVNLEPAARLTDFLGGHLVQGHVDGAGTVVSVIPEGNSRVFRFSAPPSVIGYCVMKGSITVNGVSLTISGLGPDYFEVTIIPHTDDVTDFKQLKDGDRVNLEVDVISKYVESHVRRVLGGAVTLLLLMTTALGGSLPQPTETVLIYGNVIADKEAPLIVRVARFKPDIFIEWESVSHQGTIHIFRNAVRDSRSFILESLFEAGVDVESPDATTVWLSERIYKDLSANGEAKIDLNRLPLKMKVTGKGVFTLEVDKESREVAALLVEDERRNQWVFQADPANPILLEFKTPRFRRYLKSVLTSSWPGLRWIKQAPAVR